jgi:SagB-type dehydrogenase family enzyme
MRQPGVGPQYHEMTKYARSEMRNLTTWAKEVPTYKEYEDPLATLELPPPQTADGVPIFEVISQRRSWRHFAPEDLPLSRLSQLLWATQGVTTQMGPHSLRASASAGALYPNETYVFANSVADCDQGIWHYDVRGHRLAQIAQGDFTAPLAQACLGQNACAEAQVVLVFAAVVDRCAWKYGDRAYRYIYMDAGHMGGQVQLAAVALGLASVNIGAFFDDEVNSLLGLDGQQEIAVYLTAIGVPA